MTTENAPIARQTWLENTLYALRGHFNEEPPKAEKDLRPLPRGEEGIVFRCADGRLDEMADLGLKRGQYYEMVSFGAALPPAGEGENLGIRAALRRALVKQDNPEHQTPPKACIFIGHEACGANATLLNTKLDPSALPEKPEEAALMQPMASPELGAALHAAKSADHALLHDEVIRSTILKSMKNVYGHKAGTTPVSKMVDRGEAQVIGAIRRLKQQEDGKFPLSVYDPSKQDFVPVGKLYDEAFPGSNRQTEAAIVDRMDQKLNGKRFGFATSAAQPSVQIGANGQMENIDAALAGQLERIYKTASQPVHAQGS